MLNNFVVLHSRSELKYSAW